MKNQRGNIYFYGLALLLFIGAVAGLIVEWDKYTARLDTQGYNRGKAEEEAAYTKRDNAALQAALASQKAAEVRAHKAEDAKWAADLAAVDNYQKGKKDGQAKTAALVAAARAGKLVFHDPGYQAGTVALCDPIGKAASGTSAQRSDGSTPGQLSGTTTQFLIGLTGECNDVARQLSAAQAVIVSDRVLCNSP